jgi:hypothetical protein
MAKEHSTNIKQGLDCEGRIKHLRRKNGDQNISNGILFAIYSVLVGFPVKFKFD